MSCKMLWIYLLHLTPIVFCISDFSINITLDYFEAVHVKFICLLSCGKDNWNQRFIKQVSLKNFAVSNVKIDKAINNSDTNLEICLRYRQVPIGIVIDSKCSQFQDVMIYASKKELLGSNHKWLIIEENDNVGGDVVKKETGLTLKTTDNINKLNKTIINCASLLDKLNLSISTDVTVVVTNGYRTYNLYEVYNFGKIRNGRFVTNIIGYWNIKTGLIITKTYKYNRRWDYKQMALKVIVVVSPVPKVFDPNIILGRNLGPGVAIVQQTGTQILDEIASAHNIRFAYTLVDRWVGDFNRDHPNAVTNALYFHDVDITPILRVLPAYLDKLDLLHPAVTFIDTRFFYKIPDHGIGNYENEFLTPLEPGAWWSVIAISGLCGIMLLLAALVEGRKMSVEFAFFSIWALICQQFFEEAEDTRRISSARKLTILVTGLLCLLIYNYYTSSVVSWLLNGPPPSINSLWELLDSPLKPLFEDVGYVHSWLDLPGYYFNKKNPKAEDAFKRRVLNMQKKGIPIFKPIHEGIEMVRKGGYVYHADLHGAYSRISRSFTQSELCDLGSLPSMEKTWLYSCVPKNSPYKEFFIWSLARFLERGVIQCIQLRTWPQIVKCGDSSPRALALGGAAPAFILLAAGFLLGTIIMFLERLNWKRNKARRNSGLLLDK